jgi:hypothetical protein
MLGVSKKEQVFWGDLKPTQRKNSYFSYVFASPHDIYGKGLSKKKTEHSITPVT